uniref:Uncharacterized protein n=1 Tax=Anguilla anguilla TaxID=7936 RepID=A0A0E9TB79_ANGAN
MSKQTFVCGAVFSCGSISAKFAFPSSLLAALSTATFIHSNIQE